MSTTNRSNGSPATLSRTRSRRRGSLPRAASLPQRVTRSRVTVHSEVEPIEGPEQLFEALAGPVPTNTITPGASAVAETVPSEREPAPGSSAEHQQLQREHDQGTRPSATFHMALQDNDLRTLEIGERVTALETEVRSMRSELLVIRAQPRITDVVREVRQLRVDYNTEREANRVLTNKIAALETQVGAQAEALELYRARIEGVENSGTPGGDRSALPTPTEPPGGTGDEDRQLEEREHSSSSRAKSRPSAKRSKKSKKRVEFSSSSESSSDTGGSSSDSDSSGDERRRRKSKRHGLTGRVKGEKFGALKELKPTNSLYKELLSYRYYRLNNASHRRTTKQTGRVSSQIKRMELSLNEHKFDGSDSIRVLDFLSRFVNETNVLGMSEGQAYLALPKFLRGFAREQYEAVNQAASAAEGGVTCWPEAVQYLLRSYATGTAIFEATSALRSLRQRADETETEFNTRLNIAEHRCGNVHTVEERMTYFVDDLDPAIKTLVARHREATRNVGVIELVQFARAEGDAHRARKGISRRLPAPGAHIRALPPKRVQRNPTLLLDTPGGSSRDPTLSGGNQEPLRLIEEHSYRDSVPTSDLTTTESLLETQDGADPALAIGYRTQIAAPRIPYQDRSDLLARQRQVSRPAAQTTGPPVQSGARQAPRAINVICHSCYIPNDHIAEVFPRDFVSIVHNYEALTAEKRAVVPATPYQRAKTLMNRRVDAAPRSSVQFLQRPDDHLSDRPERKN